MISQRFFVAVILALFISISYGSHENDEFFLESFELLNSGGRALNVSVTLHKRMLEESDDDEGFFYENTGSDNEDSFNRELLGYGPYSPYTPYVPPFPGYQPGYNPNFQPANVIPSPQCSSASLPFYCPAMNKCYSSASQCAYSTYQASIRCPANLPVFCGAGIGCVPNIAACTTNAVCSSKSQPNLCWNGSCAADPLFCPPLPGCGLNGYRCPDGSCTTSVCKGSQLTPPVCSTGYDLCETGVCMKKGTCPPFDGCPVKYMQCFDLSCLQSNELCTSYVTSLAKRSNCLLTYCWSGYCAATAGACPANPSIDASYIIASLAFQINLPTSSRRLWGRQLAGPSSVGVYFSSQDGSSSSAYLTLTSSTFNPAVKPTFTSTAVAQSIVRAIRLPNRSTLSTDTISRLRSAAVLLSVDKPVLPSQTMGVCLKSAFSASEVPTDPTKFCLAYVDGSNGFRCLSGALSAGSPGTYCSLTANLTTMVIADSSGLNSGAIHTFSLAMVMLLTYFALNGVSGL